MIDVLELIADHDLTAHSCIILTYNIDLPLYDGLIRRKLRSAGIANQVVFCDYTAYQIALQGLSAAENIGRSYSVTPIRLDGAFHPKAYLVLGKRSGRLVVGSGNASLGGLARNAELFGYFDYSEKKQAHPHSAFSQCVRLIEALAKKAATPVQEQVKRATEWSPWLGNEPEEDERTLILGGSGDVPLIYQILKIVGKRKPKRVVVCSSSFDRKLAAVEKLASTWKGCRVQCIVDPDAVSIDGKQVARLGKVITWSQFCNPTKSKKTRVDLRLHAKLIVFEFDKEEIVFFGSANASRPALLTGENIELMVVLPTNPPGTAIKTLGLRASLDQKTIYKELTKKSWKRETRASPPDIVVTGAAAEGSRVKVLLEKSKRDVPLNLALAAAPGQPFLSRAKLRLQAEAWMAEFGMIPAEARIAIVTDQKGRALSHPVSLTWSDVATIQTSQVFGAKVETAIRAMKDGTVLGTILFELLDQIPDFRIYTTPKGHTTRKGKKENQKDTSEDRTMESFYTDEVPDPSSRTRYSERSDLDLLANLIHPMESRRKAETDLLDEEGEIDDSIASEEAERREVDKKKRGATGAEVVGIGAVNSPRALKRARRKLYRRLRKAADAAEEALYAMGDVQEISANAIARQIWMVHIAAFLTGRDIQANDGTSVTCIDPEDFASFILRICRALVGGRSGGLLHKVPQGSWDKWEGKTLSRGLQFLWTFAVWAVGYFRSFWNNNDEYAEGPHDALPMYVAARFVSAVRHYCSGPDTNEIHKRLPAWRTRGQPKFKETLGIVDALAQRIARLDKSGPLRGDVVDLVSAEPLLGMLAYNEHLGATVVLDKKLGTRGWKLTLLDLSRESAEAQFLASHVVGVQTMGAHSDLLWSAIDPEG